MPHPRSEPMPHAGRTDADRDADALRALVDRAPALMGLVRLGPGPGPLAERARWTVANPALCALHGGGALEGRTLAEAHGGRLDVGLVPHVLQALEAGEPLTARELRLTVDVRGGAPYAEGLFDVTLSFLAPGLLRVFAVDTTDPAVAREQTELLAREVRDSEQRFRNLVMASAAVVWTADPEGRVVEDTPSWRAFTGQSREQVQGHGALDAVHPDDRAGVLAAWARAVRAREPYQHEYRLRRADGAWAVMLARAVPLFDAEGQVREWVGANTDVTAERQAAEHLALLAEAGTHLATSLDLGETLAAVVRTAVPRLADGCAVYLAAAAVADGAGAGAGPAEAATASDAARVSAAAADAAAPPAAAGEAEDGTHRVPAAAGAALQLVAVHHARAGQAELLRALHREAPPPPDAAQGLARVLRTGQSERLAPFAKQVLASHVRTPEQRAVLDGLQLEDGLLVALTGADGVPRGVMAFLLGGSGRRYGPADVLVAEEVARRAAVALEHARLFRLAQAERERAEVERVRAEEERARAEEASRAKDAFLATLSHELRTPLSAILGWSQLLKGGRLAPDKRARALETVERNARVQAQLIEDLLDVSRITSGKLRLVMRPLELARVVEAALETVRPAAEARGIVLSWRAQEALPVLTGDGERLQQVAWNLLSNAIKFTPSGGRVEVGLVHVGGELELSVRDSGQGISPEFLPHVFERFQQADASSSRRHGGLGLGLAIVRHLVELHGGSIRVESAGEGQGAAFVVRLPLLQRPAPAPEAAPGGPAPAADAAPARAAVRLGGVDVLLVDDEADGRELVKLVLEEAGARVTAVGSAAAALEALRAQAFGLLVSDIGMPDVDGYTLLRRVREGGESLPAVALTAYAHATDAARARDAGFQRHLTKPVDPDELIHAAAELVQHPRA